MIRVAAVAVFWSVSLVSRGGAQDEISLGSESWVNRHPSELLEIPGVVGYGAPRSVSRTPAELFVVVKDDKVPVPESMFSQPPGGDRILEWKVRTVPAVKVWSSRRGQMTGEPMRIITAGELYDYKKVPLEIDGIPTKVFGIGLEDRLRWPDVKVYPDPLPPNESWSEAKDPARRARDEARMEKFRRRAEERAQKLPDPVPQLLERARMGKAWLNRGPEELLSIPGVRGYGAHPFVSGPPGTLVVIVKDKDVLPGVPRSLFSRSPGAVGRPTLQWKIWPLKAVEGSSQAVDSSGESYRIIVGSSKDIRRIPQEINGFPVQTFVSEDPSFRLTWPRLGFEEAPRHLEIQDVLDEAIKCAKPDPPGIVSQALRALFNVVPNPSAAAGLLDKIRSLRTPRK